MSEAIGYLVRHGVTQMNSDSLNRGLLNTPLLPQGRAQAYMDAKELIKHPVTSIRASKLLRTEQHAAILGDALGIQPVFTSRLDTLDIGELTGQPEKETQKTIARLTVDEPDKKFPGGQSFNEWVNMIWPEVHLFFVLIRYGKHPVIVTHGRLTNTIDALIKGGCKYLDRKILGNPPVQQHGEIYAVRFDGIKFSYELMFKPV